MKREKTKYPGVFYRFGKRIGKSGQDKIFYVVFKKKGKVYEERIGRQYQDGMTPAKAAIIRGELIEGKLKRKAEIKEELRLQELKDREPVWTIDNLWKEYIKLKDLKGISTDKNRYKKHIKPTFGNKEPKEIISLDVKRLQVKLKKENKASGTIFNVLEILRRISNFGLKNNLCSGLTFIMEMPTRNSIKTEDLTSTQLKKLLEVIDEDLHDQAGNIMKIALYTGMRRGEIFRLEWNNIDFERGFINIIDPKGGIDQTIPLNNTAKNIFNEIREFNDSDSDFIFPGRGGNQRKDINKALKSIKTKAELPEGFRPLHGLRHVYASMLASSGKVDMYTLQKLLTHKSPLMTQRYAHLRDDTLKQASNLMDELVRESITEKVIKLEEKK